MFDVWPRHAFAKSSPSLWMGTYLLLFVRNQVGCSQWIDLETKIRNLDEVARNKDQWFDCFLTGCLKNEIRNLPRTNEHSRHNFVRQHLEIVLFARTYAPQPDHRFVSHPRMNTFLSFDERRIYHFFFFLMFCTIQVYPDSIRWDCW